MSKNNQLRIRNSTVYFLIFTKNTKGETIEGGRHVKRNVDFYNLDAIPLVGYRVNSVRATAFRQWQQ